MDFTPNNPAGRLHSILSNLVEVGTVENTKRMGELWGRALRTDETTELLVRLGKVYALPGDIARAMPNTLGYHRIDVDRWWLPLSTFFIDAHMGATWSSVSNHLGGNLLADIQSCSNKLSAFMPEPEVDASQLSDLELQLADLLDDVNNSDDISDATRRRLIDRIQHIQAAISNIWIDGTERLATELRATVEVVITAPEVRTPQPAPTVQRVGRFLSIMLNVLNIWNAANTAFPQLPDIFDIYGSPAIEELHNSELKEEQTEPEGSKKDDELEDDTDINLRSI